MHTIRLPLKTTEYDRQRNPTSLDVGGCQTFELIDQSKLDFDTVVFWKRAE